MYFNQVIAIDSAVEIADHIFPRKYFHKILFQHFLQLLFQDDISGSFIRINKPVAAKMPAL
jgi:hypothetical protein